jgi:hypothetical protein
MTNQQTTSSECPSAQCRAVRRPISRRTSILMLGAAGSLLLATACNVPIQRYFSSPQPMFPTWVNTMPRGSEAYTVAFANLDLMATLLCYCGCLTFEQPHPTVRDCYVLSSGEMNTHAAFCETCQDEAIDAVAMASAGSDWAAIREHIDATYTDRAPEFGGSGCGGASAGTMDEHGEGAACGP